MSFNHKFGQVSLICHAFNGNCTEMAISLNSKDVFVFKVPQVGQGKFVFLDRLQEHTAVVNSVDWAPKSDKIVSCSKDRTAYVWNRNNGKWKPTLVILQINRAATFVRWSPLENKFAVGSGAKLVSICSFESANDFWVSKHLKKGVSSTITCLDWHPGNSLLSCGSSDFKVRIFSAHLKGLDGTPTETKWGTPGKFNSVLWEYGSSSNGWIHSVAFNPDGNKLAWCTHASQIWVAVSSGGNTPVVLSLDMELLPWQSLLWLNNGALVGAGHNCQPYQVVLTPDSSSIQLSACLDTNSADSSTSNSGGGASSIRNRFQNIDRAGEASSDSYQLTSVHQNTINEIRKMNAHVLSSIGRDGQLVLWDLKTLQRSIQQLQI